MWRVRARVVQAEAPGQAGAARGGRHSWQGARAHAQSRHRPRGECWEHLTDVQVTQRESELRSPVHARAFHHLRGARPLALSPGSPHSPSCGHSGDPCLKVSPQSAVCTWSAATGCFPSLACPRLSRAVACVRTVFFLWVSTVRCMALLHCV